MPECQAYKCKNKAGEASCCETTEILPDSKCEYKYCSEARVVNVIAAQHWLRWTNSTSTERRPWTASRLIWSRGYFEFTELRRRLKEDVIPTEFADRKKPQARRIEQSFTFSSDHANDLLQPPNAPSHILYTYTHTRLQNKIITIAEANTSYNTNSRKPRRQAGIRYNMDPHTKWTQGSYSIILKI